MGVVAVAAVLRGLHGGVRWHEDAWRYSVYPAETLHRLITGDLLRLPLPFTGLHPPAWPLLHSLSEVLSPRPAWWLLQSLVWSLGAVVLVTRRSVWAGLLLATAPVAVHYSVEVNQYALLTFAVAGLWSTPPRDGRGVDVRVVLWALLAAWTHALGGVAAVLALVSLPGGRRWGSLGVFGVGCLPLVPSVLEALQDGGTFAQPEWKAELVVRDLMGRFGGLGLVGLGLALTQVRRAPRLALALVGGTGVVVGFVVLGVAAPHQFPYLLTLLPVVALLAGHHPRAAVVVVPLAVLQAGWQGTFDAQRVRALAEDVAAGGRGVDRALASLAVPWTCPGLHLEPACAGDALVLLRSAGRNDDDKNRSSPVLWRISPLWPAPRIHLPQVPAGSSDHRYGQPRLVSTPRGAFAVYVHDQVRPTLADIDRQHPRVWVVVSDVGPGSDVRTDVERLLGRSARPVGPDFVVPP